ncbi:MAG: cytochrome c oxidase accessory protein CcoG [Methylovirgula sp.]|jgi:cytochrome c oxidase accessory protein FixG
MSLADAEHNRHLTDASDHLYAAAPKIYPQSVHGTFRRIKWALLIVTLGIYYFLPFLRFDRGPNEPHQAVLVDLARHRFYFFFIEIWPQEVYYFTGLLIIAALTLFLLNALAGRVWCGYLCPQTVWTDLFFTVERVIEGDRRERMERDAGPWTANRIARKSVKHLIWVVIAWWTGGAWVLYFADAPTLVHQLATFQAPAVAYISIGILTFTTYTLAGHMREQVCTYMCPWPRIQAALTDDNALNVTYRYDRGEPRISLKKAVVLRTAGGTAGDCVDCGQCVAVCPTGVDIRGGPNLGCIQCGLCIDACDTVMKRIGRPPRLIAYDTDVNIRRRLAGLPNVFRPIRVRTVLYMLFIAVVGGIMLATLASRSDLGISALHDRNPLYLQLADGSIRNAYTVRILNHETATNSYVLKVIPFSAAQVTAIGTPKDAEGWPKVEVGPDQTYELRVLVTLPASATDQPSRDITFQAIDQTTGRIATTRDHFLTQ